MRTKSFFLLIVIPVSLSLLIPIGVLLGRPAQPPNISENFMTTKGQSKLTDENLVQLLQKPLILPENGIRASRLTYLAVEGGGGMMFVQGMGEIIDTTPDLQYVWLLRIYANEGSKQLINEHHYIAQAITLAEGEQKASPTFKDSFDMNPGSYRVELTLYGVPKDFNFGDLRFGESMRSTARSKVSNFKRVVVL